MVQYNKNGAVCGGLKSLVTDFWDKLGEHYSITKFSNNSTSSTLSKAWSMEHLDKIEPTSNDMLLKLDNHMVSIPHMWEILTVSFLSYGRPYY